MPLETAAYISDLNVANPAHTDGLSQADSHMRLTKAALKATFPNFTAAALTSTQAQLDAAVAAIVLGTAPGRFPLGTALLPGLTPFGDTNTGILSPAADQLAFSLGGTQVLLMGGSSLVTSLGVAANAFTTTGAYSGGTGQLVPIGSTLLWWDDVLPTEGGYAWANGQIIASANTVCPVLLARWGTRFGGNGVTTMGVPDLRDTVPVGKSTMGAVASRALQTLANTVLNALFGEANHALVIGENATHSHGNTINDFGHTHGIRVGATGGGVDHVTQGDFGTASIAAGGPTGPVQNATTGITITNANSGNGTAHNNVQPSTTCNYIIRLA